MRNPRNGNEKSAKIQILTTSQFLPIKMKRSHEDNRKLICLVCFEKKRHLNNITEVSKVIVNIREFFIPDYDPKCEYYPSSICSQCRKMLSKAKDNENVILPAPFNFSTMSISKLTRNQDFCECLICEKARKTITPGTAKPTSRAGRPSSNQPDILPPAKPITVCERCLSVIGKGLPHPCTITERRFNLQTDVFKGSFLVSVHKLHFFPFILFNKYFVILS